MTNILFPESSLAIIKTTQRKMRKSKKMNREESIMLNENVTKVLETSMWDLSTCADGEPNVVPVAFKFVTKDGKLAVGDVFLDTTLRNLRENNGKIAVSVYDASSLTKTTHPGKLPPDFQPQLSFDGMERTVCDYIAGMTDNYAVEKFREMVETMFHGAASAKGALLITPEKVIVTTPGADNKKEL